MLGKVINEITTTDLNDHQEQTKYVPSLQHTANNQSAGPKIKMGPTNAPKRTSDKVVQPKNATRHLITLIAETANLIIKEKNN